jgi:Tfp pilus assembly protein PilP
MTMKLRLAVVAILITPYGASSQTIAPAGGAASPAAGPAVAPAPFVYQVEGRRDPFVNPSEYGAAPIQRGAGVAGLAVNEILLRGILESRGSLLAMIQGTDKRTYIVRPGDKLADGIVASVTSQGLNLLQDIPDPLSRHKQQEVRKLLRSPEGAKE